MSAIDEGIVREYFEQNGFLVRQVRKYQVQARKKTSDEEIDLVVYNPAWTRGGRRPDFFLFASELPHIHRAVVAVKPWHTGVFTPAMLKSSPEIFRFLESEVLKEVPKLFPSDAEAVVGGGGNEPAASGSSGAASEDAAHVTKILVLPGLPTQEPFRTQSIAVLKERGVDAIISFRAMLTDLIDRIEINRNYQKSDTLQMIRLLKNYDLLRDTQLDLLPAEGGRKRGGGGS